MNIATSYSDPMNPLINSCAQVWSVLEVRRVNRYSAGMAQYLMPCSTAYALCKHLSVTVLMCIDPIESLVIILKHRVAIVGRGRSHLVL